jgi:hypothetical protein
MKVLFKILDYVSAVFMGTATLFLVTLAVGRDWNMFVAMIAGMVIGMGVLMLALLLFTSFSAAFEVFTVGMAITMPVGMAAGMALAAAAPNLICMLTAAAVFSMVAQLGFDLYNMKLKGDVPVDK